MEPLSLLREADRAAYLAVLTAPASVRADLAALAAYAVELARVPLAVNEPAAGEIRLRWWAEVALGERDGEGRGHPVGAALLSAIERHALPREALAGMADARSFDLYHDPMPDRDAFEAYAGAIASVPVQMACRVLDPDAANRSADAAGHAGVYATAVDRLSTLARDRASGRVFVPADVLLQGWTSPVELTDPGFAERDMEAAARLAKAMLGYVAEHRVAFVDACTSLPASLAPAFASAHARTVTERAVATMGTAMLDAPPPAQPLREQRAVMRTHRLFDGGDGGGLLGRLRRGFGR